MQYIRAGEVLDLGMMVVDEAETRDFIEAAYFPE